MFALALLAIVGASTVVALANWRLGVVLALLVGQLQDPLRKMTPGAPAVMVLASLPIWGAVWFSVLRQETVDRQRLLARTKGSSKLIGLFVLTLIPPVFITLGYGGAAWQVALLGLFSYVAPVLTLLVGYSYAQTPRDVMRLLRIYVLFTAVMLVGTPIEYLRLLEGLPALGTGSLSATPWIRFGLEGGGWIRLIAGFYRSPDIMAWHAGAVAMCSAAFLMLHFRAGRLTRCIPWAALLVFAGTCLLMGGRRKAMMMPMVMGFALLFLYARRQRLGAVMALAAIATAGMMGLSAVADEVGIGEGYLGYAYSLAAAAPARFMQGSVGSVVETLRQAGPLGAGIGTATQGRQHISIPVETWQESGPSKLMVELGLPGFVCAIVLALVVARLLVRSLDRLPGRRLSSDLALSVAGMLLASSASFIVSHQSYTDLSVLSLTALLPGFLLRSPEWGGQVHRTTEPVVTNRIA